MLTDTPTTEIYTLSLHDALPICGHVGERLEREGGALDRVYSVGPERASGVGAELRDDRGGLERTRRAAAAVDRKSTRLNSSHRTISYAVFCLKKKTSILAYSVPA